MRRPAYGRRHLRLSAVQSLGEVATRFSAWNDARVTRKALSKLTDRELDDIGLCRGDVDLIGR